MISTSNSSFAPLLSPTSASSSSTTSEANIKNANIASATQRPFIITTSLPDHSAPPPPSAHDDIVAPLIAPRPPIVRSSSTPGPKRDTKSKPQRHEGAEVADVGDLVGSGSDVRPVFAILDGKLEPRGTRVARALRSQIEAVLAVQEVIGHAHLALEGVTAHCLPITKSNSGVGEEKWEGKEEIARRQEGVEMLMAQLDTLAATLKNYHALGTPAIVFPPVPRRANDSTSSETAALGAFRTATPNTPTRDIAAATVRPESGAGPVIGASPLSALAPVHVPPISRTVSATLAGTPTSPLNHPTIHPLYGPTYNTLPTLRSPLSRSPPTHAGDLDTPSESPRDTPLETSPSRITAPLRTSSPRPSPPHLKRNQESWLDNRVPARIIDSPSEMVDRSRPW